MVEIWQRSSQGLVICRSMEVQDDAGEVLWPGSCEVGAAEQRAVSGFVQHVVI